MTQYSNILFQWCLVHVTLLSPHLDDLSSPMRRRYLMFSSTTCFSHLLRIYLLDAYHFQGVHKQNNMCRKGRVPTHSDLLYGEGVWKTYNKKNARARCQHGSHKADVMRKCIYFQLKKNTKHQAFLFKVKKLNTDGNNQGRLQIGSVAWGRIERCEGLREAEKTGWCEPRQCFSKALHCWWCAQCTDTPLLCIQNNGYTVVLLQYCSYCAWTSQHEGFLQLSFDTFILWKKKGLSFMWMHRWHRSILASLLVLCPSPYCLTHSQ